MQNLPSSIVILPADKVFTRHSEASIVELKDQTLLMAWSKFFGNHDNSKSHIAARISEDGGHSWTNERILVPNDAGLNVMSPGLRRLGDGSLGLIYSFRESKKKARRLFRRSFDDGKTWTPSINITEDGYQTGAHDRLTVLSTGRIIAPLHCTQDWDEHYLYIKVARSDDLGRTWKLSDSVTLPKLDVAESGAQEPDVVERTDGSLLMIMRTATGSIYRAESFDQGVHWIKLKSTDIIAPIAPSIIRRIPNSEDLMLIWNWVYDPTDPMLGRRKQLACAISKDGGDSWPMEYRKILEQGDEDCFSYPSCTFYKSQALLTYYVMEEGVEFNFDGPRSLKLMRFPISWLYS